VYPVVYLTKEETVIVTVLIVIIVVYLSFGTFPLPCGAEVNTFSVLFQPWVMYNWPSTAVASGVGE